MSDYQQPGTSFQSTNKLIAEYTFVEDTLDNNNNNNLVELKEIDMWNIAKIEYGWCGENCRVIFKVIGSEELETQLGHYKDILEEKQSLTFIINLNNYHWVTLVITHQNRQFSAYYVDSLGEELPFNINNVLKDVNIKDLKIKQQHDEYLHGIFALENAKVINEALQKSNDPQAAVSNLQLTDDLLRATREEFARALRRRNRIESKFKVVLKFLKELNKQQSKIENFNYQNANILLFSLETLALQDPILQDSSCPDPKTKLWNYEQKLVDQGIIDLVDLKRVQYIRSDKIFHRNALSIINPADFKGIVNLNKDNGIKEFFQDLERYVQQTYAKLRGQMNDQSNHMKLTQLFKRQNKIGHFGKTITCDQMKEEILAFFKNVTAEECYCNDRLNLEKANEMIFNFVVNTIPFIDKAYEKPVERLRKIKLFRGDLIHKFYEFGDNYKLMGFAFKNFVRSYGPSFFKYYYSQEVHFAFNKVGHLEVDYISNHLRNLLTEFQNKFGREYLAAKEKIDKENSFEFVASGLVHSEIKNKNDLEKCVHEYFKLMSVIDNEETIEERVRKYKESDVPARYKELSANDRREIYEDFKLLKDLFKMNKNGISGCEDIYDKKKKLLLKKFEGPYGISKDDFNAMIESYVENDECGSIDGESTVTYALDVFKKIKEHHSSLSNEVIIDMFNKRKDVKGNKGSPEAKINSIPEGKTIKISVPSGKADKTETVSINTDRFAKNIFEMFNNTYIKYRLVFNNIEEAFNDEIFLDYLENENVNKNIIQKLLKIDYMTPYVARLFAKDELIKKKIITGKEFLETVEKLFKEDSYIKHLKKVLKEGISNEKLKSILKPDDKNFNKNNIQPEFYKQICNKIINNDVNIENMHLIFKDLVFTNVILGTLIKKIDSCTVSEQETNAAKLIKKILKLLNSIANELYNRNEKDLNLALALLDSEKGAKKARNMLINKKLAEKNDLDILQAKRNIARIKNRQGELEKDTAKAKKLYKEAYNILDSMKNVTANSSDSSLFPHFLLTLSDLAYTHRLLHECSRAYEIFETLYKEMLKSILNLYDNDLSQCEWNVENYNNIVQSEKYQRILEVSPKYLNILKIKSDMANELTCLADFKQKSLPNKASQDYETKFNEVLQNFQSALKIYEEVYKIKEADKRFVLDSVKTMRAIAYIHIRLGHFKLSNAHNEEKLKCVLYHFEKAYEKNKEREEIMAKEKWETHPAVLEIQQDIIKVLYNIAFTHNRLGEIGLKQSSNPEKAVEYYIIALTIYEELLYIQEKRLGKEHEYTLNNMSDIAFTNYNLAKVKSQNNPEEALKHCKEAKNNYEKILEIQKKSLGLKHSKTKKTRENLARTNVWMNDLYQRSQQKQASSTEIGNL
ncbi:hypothetical protein AVEN_66720-1 [Araneus ventricosus]|uniref:Ubiquitin-like protease family profile domain-containing protein n=1 Tax=Araneus ventricosus TaxID=182803 RepID=A0A4Y2JKX5_ARAVE|nr:hypothetical protein AVEN_66720-1 [Araneus ventricosus]